jgi:hypothetical protein
LLDVAVVPGTQTVFILCDQGNNDGDGLLNEDPPDGVDNDVDGLIDEDPGVVLYRSDDGGYQWGAPSAVMGPPLVAPILATEIGVQVEPSPNYHQDGTVFVLTNDPVLLRGRVYTSVDKGVAWWALGTTPPTLFQANCLAVDPNFNSLLSGGTIAVGMATLGAGFGCVTWITWQSPVVGWTAAWVIPPHVTLGADCLALKYAPTSSVRLIAVMNDNLGFVPAISGIWGITGSIITGFQALVGAMPGTYLGIGLPDDGCVLVHASAAWLERQERSSPRLRSPSAPTTTRCHLRPAPTARCTSSSPPMVWVLRE